jgi:hypothetical protein
MANNNYEVIKRELSSSSPQHGSILAMIVRDLAPEQIQKLQERAAEGQMALELEALRKVHQFQASSADIDQFIEHVKGLEMTLKDGFTTYSAQGTFKTATGTTTIQAKKHCYIATAVYGSPFHPNVLLLKHFRDTHLETRATGRCLTRLYYRIGPRLAHSAFCRNFCAHITRSILNCICRALCLFRMH